MTQKDCISRRQTVAVAFVAILSPLIRRFPRVLAETAGRTAWLSAPFSAIPLAAGIALGFLFFRRRQGPTSYATVLTDTLGKIPGRIVTLLYTIWVLFYAGFLLRSGAARFISTVYPGAGPWLFITVSSLVCALAALGSLRAVARAAMIFRPLLIAVFAAAILLTVKDIDFGELLPVTAADLLPNGYAALKTVNVLSIAAFMTFLGDKVEGRLRVRDLAPWGAALLLIIAAMTVSSIGMFGPELTAKLTYPFFMLVRDVSILGSLERAEPVVIALWVFSDFILVSILLQIAGKNLRECFGCAETGTPPHFSDFSRGRWMLLLCVVLIAAAGLLAAPDVQTFELFSETIIPLGNALFVFVLPLPVLVIGLLRGKI